MYVTDPSISSQVLWLFKIKGVQGLLLHVQIVLPTYNPNISSQVLWLSQFKYIYTSTYSKIIGHFLYLLGKLIFLQISKGMFTASV